LCHCHIQGSAVARRDDFPKIVLDETRNLPIRRIMFNASSSDRSELQEKGLKACDLVLREANPLPALGFVENQLGHQTPHDEVVHDMLAHLGRQMMRLHKRRQELWDRLRPGFLNCGIDPDDISSLSVTRAMRDYVQNARAKTSRTRKQSRMRTYADQVERAFGCSLDELYEDEAHDYGFEDLPRLGFERFKWLAALRGADPSLLDDAWKAVEDDVYALRDVLERIGSGDWYPQRDPNTGEYDMHNIRSTDWLIDQIVYRLYGLTEEEIRVVEGCED
jgi:hypothetical protein